MGPSVPLTGLQSLRPPAEVPNARQLKNSRKGCRVGQGKTAEKNSRKNSRNTRNTVKTANCRSRPSGLELSGFWGVPKTIEPHLYAGEVLLNDHPHHFPRITNTRIRIGPAPHRVFRALLRDFGGPASGDSFRTLFGLFRGSGPEGPRRPCAGRGRS